MVNSSNQKNSFQNNLKLSELNFQAIAESVEDALIITDENSTIIFLNSTTLEEFGYSEKELIGQPIACLLSKNGENTYSQIIKKLQTSQNPSLDESFEIQGVGKDGDIFPARLSVSVLHKNEHSLFVTTIRNLFLNKSIESRLKESEEMYRLLAENSTDIIARISLDGHILYVSPSCKDILGYTQDELLGANTFDFYHPDAKKSMHETYQKVLNRKKQSIITIRFRKKDESYLWLESSIRTIRNTDDQPIELQTSSRDITLRKKTEDDLVENQYFINRVMNSTPVIISVYDIINKVNVYTNGEITDALGYTKEDLKNMGNTIAEKIIHPDDLEEYHNRGEKLEKLKSGETFEREYRAKTINGDYKWFLTKENVFKRTSDGKVWQSLTISLDITDKKNAEEALKKAKEDLKIANEQLESKVLSQTVELRKSESLLRNITSTLPAFISFIDRNQIYQFVNEYFMHLSFVDGSPIGKHMVDVVGKEIYKEFKEAVDKAFSGKVVTRINNVKLKNGDKRTVEIIYTPYQSDANYVHGVVMMGVDITDRLKNEKELNAKNKELFRTNKDLDNFIYTASHELRAPISNIEGLTNAIKNISCYISDEELKELINLMETSIEKFKNTIVHLTEINRVNREEDGKIEKLTIADIVEDIKLLLNELILTTKAKIHYSFQVEEINFSKKNLKSIIYNLLNNALKYHSSKRIPKIELSTEKSGDYVLLCVKDNGLGIPKEKVETAFSMFKRFHVHVEGAGVGLYVVKRILDNTEGKIEIESEEDKGTIVKVYLKESKK